jgi:hypothetical protein
LLEAGKALRFLDEENVVQTTWRRLEGELA